MSREQYETSPPKTEDYTGERYKYGFQSKPAFPYYSKASCPNGAIFGTYKKGLSGDDISAGAIFGTIKYPFKLTNQEVKSYNLIDFQKTQEATMSTQNTITESDIANVFKSKEQLVHNKVDETEKVIVDNIRSLEYFKGYAKGMNGLIDKVQNNASLQTVIDEVQMLTNQYNLHSQKNDYSPSYPNNQENPLYLKGQITGITEGVQTLRGIDINKWIENAPATETQALPDYPALNNDEKKEYTDFINVMQKNYPTANIDDLNKLCGIASEMKKFTVQNNNNILSTERFNTLTDHQESQIKGLTKDMPGLKVSVPYHTRAAAINFCLPQGQTSSLDSIGSTYSIPEIPSNKLVPQKTNEFISPFNNTVTKTQSR